MQQKECLLLLVGLSLFFVTGRTSCNSTAVQLAQVPPTGGSIATSGTYYLGSDITGSLVIDANKVTLNLNGHTVRNIIITERNNVTITNGVVESSADLAPAASAGIMMSNSSNILLSDVTVVYTGPTSSGIQGIYIQGGRNLSVSNVCVEGFPSTGCTVEGAPRLAFITDCTFAKNGSAGLSMNLDTGTVVTIVKRCSAIENKTDGFSIRSNGSRASVWFFDCIASDNSSFGFHGFQPSLLFRSCFTAIGCIAASNANSGFRTDSRTEFYFQQCAAYSNGITTIQGDGFFAQGDSLGNVKECTSLNNSVCGFNNNGEGNQNNPVTYVANFSHGNAGNYCRNASIHTGLPYDVRKSHEDEAQFWRNTEP